MDAFARMTNRREREYQEQLLLFVPILDRVYLKDFYDKQKEEMEKQRKKHEKPQAPTRGVGGRRTTAQRRR
jgi:hypothetical protein